MNKKYLIAFVFSALLIGLLVMFFSVKYNTLQHYSNSSDDQNKSGQIIIRQFEQNLLLHYRTYHNGITKTTVSLFLSENEVSAASYEFRGEFEKPEINLIYDENGLTCYEWLSKSTCIITYKYENSKVKAYPPIIPNDSDYNLLHPALKQEFMTKDWRRIQAFGEVLLKNKDSDVRAILERYASGSFTTEEIGQNEKSNSVTPNQIQVFSQCLLDRVQ